MGEPISILAREVASVPDVIDRQDRLLAGSVRELSARLRLAPPRVVVTCARGSSAHAGTFAKHLLELHLGLPVAAAAPSIASIYRRRLKLNGQLVLAISQSGASDDLIAHLRGKHAIRERLRSPSLTMRTRGLPPRAPTCSQSAPGRN